MQYYPYYDYTKHQFLGQDISDLGKKYRAYWAGKFVIGGKPLPKTQAQQIALQEFAKVEKYLKNLIAKGESEYTVNAAASLPSEVENINAMLDIYKRLYRDNYLQDSQYFKRIQGYITKLEQWEPQKQITVEVDPLVKITRPQSVPSVTIDYETGETKPIESVVPGMEIVTSRKAISELQKALQNQQALTEQQKQLHKKMMQMYQAKPQPIAHTQDTSKEREKTKMGISALLAAIAAAGATYLALR